MDILIQDKKGRACISTDGAQLLSWQNSRGQELIWQRDPAVWPRSAPLLFPVIGNCRNDQLYIKKRIYPMPKHGFLRDREFTVVWRLKKEVVLEYRSGAEDLRFYPWPFIFRAIYRMKDGNLLLRYEITNLAEEEMYYCFGGHPGFNLSLEEGVDLADFGLRFPKDKELQAVAYDLEAKAFDPKSSYPIQLTEGILPLKHELFAGDAVFIPRLKSRSVDLVHLHSSKGLRFTFKGFAGLALWTTYPVKAPFICLEPWQGSAIWKDENNQLEQKREVRRLASQAMHTYEIKLTYLEGSV